MALYKLLYKVTTGPVNVKRLLTPVGFLAFSAIVLAVIGSGILLDRWLGFPPLLPGRPGLVAGIPLLALGAFFSGWSIAVFAEERGTPVPFNPPPRLVVKGPYTHSRNPMLAGLFLMFFGLGFLFGSIGLTAIMTPVLIVVSIIGLKLVEEPELERRLGDAYVEYRRMTPMFLPRLRSHGKRVGC
jgi:protein-S-isoprenylcysteine O-methyltransferase Ste14